MSDFEFRFGGVARLYGADGLRRLAASTVMVVGLGGVGSWVVEALARSGIGGLTLVDLDEVCVSNVNRQLPALDGDIGRAKGDVLAERVLRIHPGCRVTAVPQFYMASTELRLLPGSEGDGGMEAGVVAVVDAIDDVANKCRLLARCRWLGLPVVCCGGAGGRRDPTRIRLADMVKVSHDRLLAGVRKRLRREHGFPKGELDFDIPCVYSEETRVFPAGSGEEGPCVADAEVPAGGSMRLDCEGRLGSVSFVTGAFGFVAASWIVGLIAGGGLRRNSNKSVARPVDHD